MVHLEFTEAVEVIYLMRGSMYKYSEVNHTLSLSKAVRLFQLVSFIIILRMYIYCAPSEQDKGKIP